MGNSGMFFGRENFRTEKDKQTALDRFLAATLAFGHTGFLAMEHGFSGGLRSYFIVQQIAKRYGTQKVKSIRYADENGNLLTTSEAVAADKFKLNRLVIEYEDGLKIYVNGNSEQKSNRWYVNDLRDTTTQKLGTYLSPNDWYVDDPTEALTAWSFEWNMGRTDYIDSPAYLFAEIRNNPKGSPHRFDRLLCDRQLIVLKNVDNEGRWEMIVGEPNYEARSTLHAVRLDNNADADVVALDFERKVIGKAETRYSRGYVHVMPVDGAFSYLLTPKAKPENIPPFSESKRFKVVPGENIGTITIPPDIKANTLYWINGYDFEIVPLCNVDSNFDTKNSSIDFTIISNLDTENSFRFELQQNEKTETKQNILLTPNQFQKLSFKIDIPTEPQTIPLKLTGTSGNMKFEQKYQLKSVLGFQAQPKLPEHFETGYCLRGKKPTAMDGRSGAYVYLDQCSCGEKTQRGWAIHPPFQGGTGYTFLLSEPITVPKEDGIAFSSEVGIRNGGDPSDGVLYRVFVAETNKPDKEEILAGEILWAERNWSPFICDLSAWQGKTVRLRLVADVGTKNNSVADWAAWANLKLVSTKQSLITILTAEP